MESMAFCTECGANIPDDVRFCTGCGRPVNTAGRASPVTAASRQGAPVMPPAAAQASPVQTPPMQASPQAPPMQAPQSARRSPPVAGRARAAEDTQIKSGYSGVVGTGAYIGMMILFAIPIVGWIACIVTACKAGNRSRRNFAKATLILLVIGLVLSVALYIVLGWIWEAIAEYTQSYAGISGGLSGLVEILGEAG